MTAKTAHTTTPYTLEKIKTYIKNKLTIFVSESKRLGTDIMMKTIDD